jgi:phosphoglucomutase
MQVIDSLTDYVDLMKEIFDFSAIKTYLLSHKILVNSLHGGANP